MVNIHNDNDEVYRAATRTSNPECHNGTWQMYVVRMTRITGITGITRITGTAHTGFSLDWRYSKEFWCETLENKKLPPFFYLWQILMSSSWMDKVPLSGSSSSSQNFKNTSFQQFEIMANQSHNGFNAMMMLPCLVVSWPASHALSP